VIVGLCQVPYPQGASPQPFPTVASYRALRALGVDGLRLQFDLSIAAPLPDKWDRSLFRAWIEPAFEAGMNINANYCVGAGPQSYAPVFHERAAFELAKEFGRMVKSWSFENEPGPKAQAYEGDDGPTATRDYMRDVYMPMCLAFVRGIRRAIPDAWIGGCDSDSATIQKRYTDLIDHMFSNAGAELHPLGPICDEEWIHNYGDVGGGHYARLRGEPDDPGFLDVRTSRPMGISEIDHQQFPSAIKRAVFAAASARARGESDSEAAIVGALARLRPAPEETMALVDLLRRVGREFRDCTRFMLGCPDYFFERGTISGTGLTCCSFYLAEPVVSDGGRAFAAAIAEINRPADPPKKALPVRKRAVRSK